MSMRLYIKRGVDWAVKLTPRERVTIGLTLGLAAVVSAWALVGEVRSALAVREQRLQVRLSELTKLTEEAQRYNRLKGNFDRFVESIGEEVLDFEGVARKLDEVVKKQSAISSYDLRKLGEPEPFLDDFKRQDFSISLRSIPMEKLLPLLFNLENQGKQLVLTGVTLEKSNREGDFAAKLRVTVMQAAS